MWRTRPINENPTQSSAIVMPSTIAWSRSFPQSSLSMFGNATMIDSLDRSSGCHIEGGLTMKDKLQGKFEEAKGKLTDDKGEELKGKGRQTVGGVKQTGKELAYEAEHPDRPEESGPTR